MHWNSLIIHSCGHNRRTAFSEIAAKVVIFTFISVFTSSGVGKSNLSYAASPKKPFSVTDGISLTYFGGGEGVSVRDSAGGGPVRFSPNGKYFAVHTERGRPAENVVEDSLSFYRSSDVIRFLRQPNMAIPPKPFWALAFREKEGAIVSDWYWLPNSKSVVFLARSASGNKRLKLADIQRKKVQALSLPSERVEKFDVRDGQHYVYTAANPSAAQAHVRRERRLPAFVATGRSLDELLFPTDSVSGSNPSSYFYYRSRYTLRAVIGNRRFEVKHFGESIIPRRTLGDLPLVLAPDSRYVVTTMQIPKSPESWESLYLPPEEQSPYRVRTEQPTSQYVLIDLNSGSVTSLTDAPTGNDAGWFTFVKPSWTRQGQAIVLPGTFLKSEVPSRPCIAVVDLGSKNASCVELLQGSGLGAVGNASYTIQNVRFGKSSNEVIVEVRYRDLSLEEITYEQAADGAWRVVSRSRKLQTAKRGDLEVKVTQSWESPPRLVASYHDQSRVIWDPNPELERIELGETRLESWKDEDGREWGGGLYLPKDYTAGRRYPLVIQTHGFSESEFLPSGIYPTGFAARALAASGIAVLQVHEPCPIATPSEAHCAISGYEAVLTKLEAEGLIDPQRIGIIGFSRTCYYVMEMLTKSSHPIRAASITDGQMLTYLQYILTVGYGSGDIQPQFDAVIGSKPFGAGLQTWFTRSPGFNVDKITTPLLVVAEGPHSLLSFMWEPYAALFSLRKPVELIVLNTDEHILTNPLMQLQSQGDSVDWFRFWLKGEESSDPSKADRYSRWRGLRSASGQLINAASR